MGPTILSILYLSHLIRVIIYLSNLIRFIFYHELYYMHDILELNDLNLDSNHFIFFLLK